MKLLPITAMITKSFECTTIGETKIAKGVVAIKKEFAKDGEKDVTFQMVSAFGATGDYLLKYGGKGQRIFLREWNVEQKKINDIVFYDFTIQKVDILDKKKEEK